MTAAQFKCLFPSITRKKNKKKKTRERERERRLSQKEHFSAPFLLLGDLDRHLDAAGALFGVDEKVLPRLLCLPRDFARGLVVVELLDDESLGLLELLLGLEADR